MLQNTMKRRMIESSIRARRHEYMYMHLHCKAYLLTVPPAGQELVSQTWGALDWQRQEDASSRELCKIGHSAMIRPIMSLHDMAISLSFKVAVQVQLEPSAAGHDTSFIHLCDHFVAFCLLYKTRAASS